MISAAVGFKALRALGLRSLLPYARYQLKLRSGWLRLATPPKPWPAAPAPAARPKGGGRPFGEPIGLTAGAPWQARAEADAIAKGEQLLAGRFPVFGELTADVGVPPDWHRFLPLAGGERAESVPADRHWTAYDDQALTADVKLLWELSRFSWVYALARAYRWSGQRRFAAAFWSLLASWAEANPPNRGPQWMSAQEVAFRLLALGFARGAFEPWLNEEPGRQARLASLIQAHAERIPPTLDYSRAQRNNHRIAEAVALMLAGNGFPNLPGALRWRRLGRAELVAALANQVLSDGGYSQHSHNYARLALELGMVACLLARQAGNPLPEEAAEALRRLARLLSAMAESTSGRLPNFGPNDGTHLLPLTSCSFRDYRPSLQAAAGMLGGVPGYPPGPWDELCRWLATEPAPPGEHSAGSADFPEAGLFRLGGTGSHLVVRAASFRSRPGHSDQLHLDLWWRDTNLALDPGTYLYGGAPPWDNQLMGAEVHNTLTVDGQDPMWRAGRFLWLNWSRATLQERRSTDGGKLALVHAVHDGYRSRGVRHHRTVLWVADGHLLVIDDLLGEGTHHYLLPWLLPDGQWALVDGGIRVQLSPGPARLTVEGPAAEHGVYRQGERVEGELLLPSPKRWGWWSPTYAHKEPALHWLTAGRGELPLQIRSWWSLGEADRAGLSLEWQERPGPVPRLVAAAYNGVRLER